MSECCTNTSPKIIIRPNSCGQATVSAPKSNSEAGIGCVPSTPRDLVGQGLLVSVYYYEGSVDQVEFSGPDKNGNELLGSDNSMVFVNGVMLDDDCYTLTASVLTLGDPCQTDEDIVSVVVFREPEGTGESRGVLTTLDVSTIPTDDSVTRPQENAPSLELVTTQFDANWFLNDRIDEVEKKVLDIEIPEGNDLSDYATTEWVMNQGFIDEQPVTDGDAATLASANEYTDSKVAAIEIPEGADLSNYAETTYVDGADQAVQRFATTADESILNAAKKYTDDSLGTIPDVSSDVDKAYVDEQDATKIGNTGEQVLPTSVWKLRARKVDDSGVYSYISIKEDRLGLYHIADPTSDAHGMSRGFADARYQFIQKQIVFKCDQYAACSTNPNPAPGEFCGLNNSSPGSPTSPNPYFGNWNDGIRVSTDKLLNPEGNQFSDMERYTIEGTVTILDKNGKLYFKAAVSSVSRTNNNSYVTINFSSRVPAFGTGAYNDTDQYVLIVEGLESVQPATVNIPED